MLRPLLLLALLAAGCTETVHTNVQCLPGEDGFKCSITEDQGKADIEVCFDITLKCAEGAPIVGKHNCKHVSDGKTVELAVSNSNFPGADKCQLQGMSLDNMTIDGKAGDPSIKGPEADKKAEPEKK